MRRSDKLSAKFSEPQCEAIRAMWRTKRSFREIAKIYGVHHKTISMICQPKYAKRCGKKTYQWIKGHYPPEKRKEHLAAVKARIKIVDPDASAIYQMKWKARKLTQKNSEKNSRHDSDRNASPNERIRILAQN